MSLGTYTKGLHEVADGVHAYIQPDGSWGWSNAGIAVGDGASLLVDTLFDLKLTAEMLTTMAGLTEASPISTLVNTHANGDHCYGNQLVDGPGVEIVASVAAARELDEVSPQQLADAVEADLPEPLGSFMRHAFGPFALAEIEVPPVTRSFSGGLELEIGGKQIRLIEVGPAHTAGDVVAWLPQERVLFAGDILFVGGTPIMWAGPIGNWIAACDLIEELDPAVVVPGHGPLTDLAGVREVGDYLRFVQAEATQRHAAGMAPDEASREIDLAVNGTRFGSWTDRERLVVTVHSIWRELEPDRPAPGLIALFSAMAEDFAARRGPAA
jgi:glyoxylase-like metal-dependent hydrolase (beta-lactamase superfamily II)